MFTASSDTNEEGRGKNGSQGIDVDASAECCAVSEIKCVFFLCPSLYL